MVAHGPPVYRYEVDEADTIVLVDEWWLAFAKENSAAELQESTVLGRVIWDFISDEPTRTLYQELHAHVRSSGRPITLPFRCDSPTLQRYMQVTISQPVVQRLRYESTLIRAVPQRHLALLASPRGRSTPDLLMCSFCKRSQLESGSWLDMEDISLRLRLYDQTQVPGLRYTVCPRCAAQAQHELETAQQRTD